MSTPRQSGGMDDGAEAMNAEPCACCGTGKTLHSGVERFCPIIATYRPAAPADDSAEVAALAGLCTEYGNALRNIVSQYVRPGVSDSYKVGAMYETARIALAAREPNTATPP